MITVTATHNFNVERVIDLLCCALEGGSNYWAEFSCNLKDYSDFTAPQWSLVVHDLEEDQKHIIEYEDILKGLQTLTTISKGKHFKDFLFENEDAITGDCFLQCCVFNEVIYG